MSAAAFGVSTLVHTARGVIPAAQVQVGDTAFSLDEDAGEIEAAPVEWVGAASMSDLIQLTIATQKVQLTGHASLLALVDRRRPGRIRRRFRREWVRAKDIRPGDLVALALKTPDLGAPHAMTIPVPRGVQLRRSNPVELPAESSLDLMWLAGLFIGDGWIDSYRGSKQVSFAIPRSDEALRAVLYDASVRTFGVPVRSKSDWTVSINSFRVADYLEANGLRGNAHTKRIPSWVATIPEEQRLAFLGGYVDADGHVAASRTDKGMSITSSNPELLEDTGRIAAMCGLRCGSSYRFEGTRGGRIQVGYRVRILGNFDRVGCRSPQRTSRLNQRHYKRNFTSTSSTGFRAHANAWFGYALVKAVAPIGTGLTLAIRTQASNLITEGVIARL